MAKDDFVYVNVDDIIMDATCQTRPMNGSTVYDYAERMREGLSFPPVIIYKDDNGNLWLADGFHRVAATKEAGLDKVRAHVHPGDQRKAILYSLGPANAAHGLPLTRADRTKRVERILSDPEWSQWSNRKIAQYCGVSNSTVGIIRSRLAESGVRFEHLKDQTERKGADGKTYQASRPKHWGLDNGMAFWSQVHKFGLDRERILLQLQPGATHLTDLTMSKEDCWRRLDQIATEAVAARFPVGSYIKHTTGRFGQVKQAHATSLRVMDFRTGSENTWMLDGCQPSSFDEWQAAVEQEQQAATQPPGIGEPPAPQPQPQPDEPAEEDNSIPDLPRRQVEFLLALHAGQPVTRNAATRLALRGHGLITDDDDWDAIRLTTRGQRAAGFYNIRAAGLDDDEQLEADPDPDEIAHIRPDTLAFEDFEADHIVEVVPALRRVLAFCEGYDIPADDDLVSDAWHVFRFFEQVTEMVAEASQQAATA